MNDHHDDESRSAETLAEDGLQRRRRQPDIEAQSPRCPKCNQLMIVTIGKKGPGYHCGCKKK